MKYRIREEIYNGHPTFFTERWFEPYNDWVAALHCSFYSLEAAQEGLDFFHANYISISTENTVIYDYTPRKIK